MQASIFPGRIEPLLKWPGGKAGELAKILPAVPSRINRYFEPFLGGAAVFLALPHDGPTFVNDKSSDLIVFYRAIASADQDFFSTLLHITRDWSELERLVTRNNDTLISLYQGYADARITKSQVAGKVHDFVLAHAREFEGMLVTSPRYNPENFHRELLRNLSGKLSRMKDIEHERGKLPLSDIADNIEGSLKSAYYMHVRHLYNYADRYGVSGGHRAAVFFFIREYAYAAMFRFNKQGCFNVPYGGISYNRKAMQPKIERMMSEETRRKFASAVLTDLDFMEFFDREAPKQDDFVFVDPPYDSDFSDYDGNFFGRADQARLADFLLSRCKANFMAVIKNTDYIASLYNDSRLTIRHFDKKYMWTIKERNNRDVTHIMITNYREGRS